MRNNLDNVKDIAQIETDFQAFMGAKIAAIAPKQPAELAKSLVLDPAPARPVHEGIAVTHLNGAAAAIARPLT